MRGGGSAFGSIDGERYANFCIVFFCRFALSGLTRQAVLASVTMPGCSGLTGLAEGRKLCMIDLSIG